MLTINNISKASICRERTEVVLQFNLLTWDVFPDQYVTKPFIKTRSQSELNRFARTAKTVLQTGKLGLETKVPFVEGKLRLLSSLHSRKKLAETR